MAAEVAKQEVVALTATVDENIATSEAAEAAAAAAAASATATTTVVTEVTTTTVVTEVTAAAPIKKEDETAAATITTTEKSDETKTATEKPAADTESAPPAAVAVAATPVVAAAKVVAPKVTVHKADFEKDVVYLYQFSRTPQLPSLSPYCLKTETFLRLTGIKYQVSRIRYRREESHKNGGRDPNGLYIRKIRGMWVEDEDERMNVREFPPTFGSIYSTLLCGNLMGYMCVCVCVT